MPERDEKTGDIDFSKDEREENERLEVETILANLGGKGYQCHISRTSPGWCAGFLDTWPMDEAISLSDIRDAYGGRRFQLRVQRPDGSFHTQRSIRIAAEPKVDGQLVPPGGKYEKGGQVVVNPPPQPPDQVTPILEALQAQQAANQELMIKMIEQKQTQSDPIEQMGSIMKVMMSMREMTDEMGSQDGLGQLTGLFAEFMKERRDAQTEKRAPVVHTKRLAPPDAAKTNPGTPPAEEEEEQTIADELTELGPEETAGILADVFDRWTPAQQQAALQAMMKPRTLDNNPVTDQNSFHNDETRED